MGDLSPGQHVNRTGKQPVTRQHSSDDTGFDTLAVTYGSTTEVAADEAESSDSECGLVVDLLLFTCHARRAHDCAVNEFFPGEEGS